ncbi:MAG TPA: undecaprenyl-phosphate glucose phosphotransferase [Desulfobacteraceae bacterium]|nr:undecaprenyl-phosphate glucose phosphotransferase [Desulfobacteraceae bacterium]HPJ66352.1 undecaprenyl-phosphate glucose phosphotransferase [Desulfobacteraceae bacterium]HPQ27196.1 undecaprenyl-phosphate glucose phosphotransferase [Desulfobacteraceae bacterium]
MNRGLIRPYHSRLALVFRLIDLLLIVYLLTAMVELRGIVFTRSYYMLVSSACALFYIIAESMGFYSSWRINRVGAEIKTLLTAWSCLMVILLAAGFILKISEEYSRQVIISWALVTPAALSIWRIIIRKTLSYFRAMGRNSRSCIIVGAGVLGVRVAEEILSLPWMGIKLRGFLDDYKTGDVEIQNGDIKLDIKGNVDNIVRLVNEESIDIVYITLPKREEEKIRNIVHGLSDTSAMVYLVPDVYTLDLVNARWTNMGNITAISIYESPHGGISGLMKLMEDFVVGAAILLIISIPMAFIAAGIKLTSPGPVLFKQRRYGLNGGEIVVWKFRTMTVCEDGETIEQARKNDPRVTRFGAFLRRTSLDELPQFINVLQGRMSIVGPRPHAVAHNQQYRKLVPGYMLRHRVKPGITGLAQINGWRGETDSIDKMEKRIKYDLQYLRNWSIWLDLKIIFMTVFGSKAGKNAY